LRKLCTGSYCPIVALSADTTSSCFEGWLPKTELPSIANATKGLALLLLGLNKIHPPLSGSVTLFCSDGMMREVVGTVGATTVAPEDTLSRRRSGAAFWRAGAVFQAGNVEDRLFTYLWLSLHTPNKHAGRVAQLIEEAERRGQAAMVERARVKAETTPEHG
jgi:hypothetical protein